MYFCLNIKNSVFLFCSTLFCCFLFLKGISQNNIYLNYSIQNFNDENFLPQNSINCIEMDENGYLWLASQLGVIRYDGKNFLSFTTKNTPALKYNRIRWLGRNAQRKIFVKDEFNNYLTIKNSFDFESVPEFGDGLTNISAANSNLLKIRIGDVIEQKKFLQSLRINQSGVSDVLCIDSMKGYLRYKNTNNEDVFSLIENGQLKSQIVIPFSVDSCKYFLFNSIIYFLHRNKKISTLTEGNLQVNASSFSAGMPTKDFFEQNTWRKAQILTNHTGVFTLINGDLYSVETGSNKPGFHFKLIFAQLPCKNVSTVYYNEKDNFYAAGSLTDGLYIIRRKDFRTRIAGNAISELDNVYAQLNLAGNRILTNSGTIFSRDNFLMAPIPKPERYSLFKDSSSYVWFFNNYTLYKTDENFSFVKKIGTISYLPVSYYQESSNTIWVGCTDGFYQIINDSVRKIAVNGTASINMYMQCFVKRNDTSFLVGSTNGLYEYNYKKNKLQIFPKAAGLSVRSIYISKEKNIYIGSYGQGFFELTDTGLVAFPLDHNSYLNTVHCFLEDNKGFFWVSTNKGLFKMAVKELNNYKSKKTDHVYYQYFDRSNGFNTNEFNGGCTPCGLKLENGLFSLPSLKGLVWFYPDSITQPFSGYKVFIDKVELDNRSIKAEDRFDLGPSFFQLRFFVSSPYFGNQDNQSIEYNLKGLNDQWIRLNDDGEIIYNSLPQGSYVLQLRKKADFGDSHYEYKSDSFRVLPHFYETAWFWLLLGVFLLFSIYLFIKIRYSFILKSKYKLEREVRTRTLEQQQLIQDLEETIKELKKSKKEQHLITETQERLISVIVHDLKSPIKFHNKIAGHLATNLDSLSLPEIKNLAIELKQSIQQIHSFVENFMFWLSVQNKSFKFKYNRIALDDFLNELLVKYNREKHSTIRFLSSSAAAAPLINADTQLLTAVVANLLDYLNKNNRNDFQTVKLIKTVTDYKIAIIPDNHELSPNQTQRINAFFSTGDIYQIEFHTEFELKIVFDFSKLLGVTIEWGEIEKKQPAVIISLPAQQAIK